jgi:addiction module HigA family antidote
MIPLSSKRTPRHPGAILMEDFLSRLPGVTQAEVADRLGMSRPRLNELVNGVRGVTPDTALRLARGFDTTPEFWMSAQAAWDLYEAARSRQRMREIERIAAWTVAPAAPERGEGEEREEGAGAAVELTTEIGVLAAEYAAGQEGGGVKYYEEFLARKELLNEARRFVRIRAQLDALHPPAGGAAGKGRARLPGLVFSAPKPNFTE